MLDELVTTQARLDWWVAACMDAGICGFDTETTGLKVVEGHDSIVGFVLALSEDQGAYIPVAHTTGETQLDFDAVVDALAPLLEDPRVVKVMHNAAFDINVCAMLGVDVQGYDDTQLMSYAYDGQLHRARGHSFDALTKHHLDYDSIRFDDVVLAELGVQHFGQVRLRHATAYASEDARMTLALYCKLHAALEDEASETAALPSLHAVYTTIDRPLARVVADMKRRGVLVDIDRLAELDRHFTRVVGEVQTEVADIIGHGVNLNSPKQLAALLYDELGLPVLDETDGGVGRTNKDTLELLVHAHPVVPLVLKHSKYSTLISNVTQAWPAFVSTRTGRVHPGFNLTTTNTRRLSGSDSLALPSQP